MSAGSLDVGAYFKAFLRVPSKLFLTWLAIVTTPTQFAEANISAADRSLRRALYFYLNSFLLIFAVNEIASRMAFFTGVSQPRALSLLAIQVAIAIPLLYVANIFFKSKPPLSAIAQAVLYVDGAYLLAFTPLQIAAHVPHFLMADLASVDIISTEIEKCIAEYSLPYWLLRGDIVFFAESYSTPLFETLRHSVEWLQYAIVLPFCWIFGKLLKARYGVPTLFNAVAAFLAFGLVVEGTTRALANLQVSIGVRSGCFQDITQRLHARYSKSAIASSAAHAASRELSLSMDKKLTVDAQGDEMIVKFWLPPQIDGFSSLRQTAQIFEVAEGLYCTPGEVLSSGRLAGVALKAVVLSRPDTVVQEKVFLPDRCVTD